MIGSKIELTQLNKIVNADIKNDAVDYSGEIRLSIINKLNNSREIIAIIADSALYTNSLELYVVNGELATSICYLHIRHREEENVIIYSFSKELNSFENLKKCDATTVKKNSEEILNDIYNLTGGIQDV